MDLAGELDYAYGLLADRFGVPFEKPGILAGNEHRDKFIETHSFRDLAISPEMVFNDRLNAIWVPGHLLTDDHPYWNSDHRLYAFAHELGHSLISQVNPGLLEANITDLMGSDVKSKEERGAALWAFDEGTADYIAIESCRASGMPGLASKADERAAGLAGFWREWLEAYRGLAPLYGADPSDWRTLALPHLEREPGMVQFVTYPLGYHFISAVQPSDIAEAIRDPPRTFKELVYPAGYSARTARP